MGFSANQARLLLLTARKSDLEFRAQQITNAEMMLAMRSEEIANKYSRRISNQTVKMVDGNKDVNITQSSLAALGYKVMVKKNGGGYAGEWEPSYTNDQSTVEKVSYKFNKEKFDSKIDEYLNEKYKDYGKVDDENEDNGEGEKDAKEKPDFNTLKESILAAIQETYPTAIDATDENWTGTVTILNEGTFDVADFFDGIVSIEKSYNTTGKDIGAELLEGIDRGQLVVVNKENKEVDIHNGTGFVVCYDTSDDELADAEYRRETSAIQVKEKRLQMEMKQIEAQQKACENEIESAKKLQDKNADSMFKYMS